MKLAKWIVGASLVTAALAQDPKPTTETPTPEYVQWMKTAGGSMPKIKKAVDAKETDPVKEEGTKLQGVFKQVEGFYANRNTPDAVKFAQDAQAAAAKLASASSPEDADAGFKALGATCQGCHRAHREKLPDGSYAIKLPK